MSAPQRRVPEDQTPLPQGYLNLKFLQCDLSFTIELRNNFAGGFSHPGHLSCIQSQDPDIGIGQFIKPPFKRRPGRPFGSAPTCLNTLTRLVNAGFQHFHQVNQLTFGHLVSNPLKQPTAAASKAARSVALSPKRPINTQ